MLFWLPCAFLRPLPILPTVRKSLEGPGWGFWSSLAAQPEWEGFRISPVLIPPPSLDFCAIHLALEGEGFFFFFLVCREEREKRKKFEVLLHHRTGNKRCDPEKVLVSGNVAPSELGYFGVFQKVLAWCRHSWWQRGHSGDAHLLCLPSFWVWVCVEENFMGICKSYSMMQKM